MRETVRKARDEQRLLTDETSDRPSRRLLAARQASRRATAVAADTPGNATAATATKWPSPPAQCPQRLRSMPLPPFPPALRRDALRPKQRGQGLAAPLRAALSRPRVCPASFAVRCRLPSHVRWSAIQHNASNYAQRIKRAVRLAPA